MRRRASGYVLPRRVVSRRIALEEWLRRVRTGRLRRRREKDQAFMWPSVDLKYADTGAFS